MREAGRITALALAAVGEAVLPGVTTGELDALAEEVIRSHGAMPAFKGYHGFPATICASPTATSASAVIRPASRMVASCADDLRAITAGA